MESKHYTNYRTERIALIESIGGEGTVIHSVIMYDEKRQKNYKYEITDNAILIVKDEVKNYVITKMIARPSRLKKYWANVPHDLLMLSVEYARKKYWI